jgi:endonuclease/exonuclease/phosphatase (EEP) superfamily protein YafD
VQIVAWALAVVIQLTLLSIVFRITPIRAIVFAQSVLPYLAVPAAVVITVGAVNDSLVLVVVGAVQVLWIGTEVLALRRHRGNSLDGPPSLNVAHSNLLHDNPTPGHAFDRLLALDVDVIAFSEITPEMHFKAESHELAQHWPFRIDAPADGPRGIALWSRHPMSDSSIDVVHDCNAAVAIITAPDSSQWRVVAVHPMAPVSRTKLRNWRPSLSTVGDILLRSDLPAVAIGDYNATHWHPPLRGLYRRGLRNAHLVLGKAHRGTFPVGSRVRPFLSLDHAIITSNVAVHDADYFAVPGSDHLAITVALSATVPIGALSAPVD